MFPKLFACDSKISTSDSDIHREEICCMGWYCLDTVTFSDYAPDSLNHWFPGAVLQTGSNTVCSHPFQCGTRIQSVQPRKWKGQDQAGWGIQHISWAASPNVAELLLSGRIPGVGQLKC
ncbi:neuromedin-U [Platysternon megacephalum]|uniref:Neuromedin-U n=1 Tax=Platysternon megacephalum TaxID=55544 RepID=A0A4D9F6Y3_9SAUR|nr:neuromedin-U [Platysternon megacephalum]